MSVEESPMLCIKIETEDDTCDSDWVCDDVFDYEAVRIKSERALLYAGHEVQEEMVIGPTEILSPPPGLKYPHWEVARRALAKEGIDNEAELQRLFGSRLELRDAADELLCAGCGQWSLTAAELQQYEEVTHSTEQPRDCLQPDACTKHQGNGVQDQPTAFTDQREKTPQPTALTHTQFICDLCQKHYITKSLLAEHIHSHTNTDSCHQCNTIFKQKDSLKQRKVNPKPKAKLSCDICSKRYVRRDLLNQHKLSHTESFKCNECGMRFNRQSNLRRHMDTHNRSKAFSCDICGKSYTQNATLTRHMLIHISSNPFECLKCGKSFTQRFSLSRHMHIHKGSKAFSCDKCGKDYYRKDAYSGHVCFPKKNLKKIACLKCDNCDESFTCKPSLVRHMRIHSGFSCGKCGKSFSRNHLFSQHVCRHTKETQRMRDIITRAREKEIHGMGESPTSISKQNHEKQEHFDS